MSYKFAAPRYRLPPMALQTVQVSVEPRLSTATHKAEMALNDRSPTVSARLRYHVSNSVVWVHRAGALAKGYPLSKLFSKAEPFPFEKEININLVYSSCLKHAYENCTGWSTAGSPANTKLTLPIVIHHHSTIACCSSAQTPSSLSTSTISTWTLDRLRMCRRVGSTRRQGNHMHDHSRFQRDINWRHRRLSLSLSLSLSPSHKSHSRTI